MEECPNYQQVKAEQPKPGGLTQTIKIPTWKWEAINIYFVVVLPKNKKLHDSILVIVNRITKSSHFIPLKSTFNAKDYAMLYIDQIVR